MEITNGFSEISVRSDVSGLSVIVCVGNSIACGR